MDEEDGSADAPNGRDWGERVEPHADDSLDLPQDDRDHRGGNTAGVHRRAHERRGVCHRRDADDRNYMRVSVSDEQARARAVGQFDFSRGGIARRK